jgi:putative RNA 2'-phosphotransferase
MLNIGVSRDMVAPMNDVRISKKLALWLRHKPEAAGLTLTPEGWAETDRILNALAVNWDRLLHVVETNDKSRFELSPDGARIRARQGHSIDVEADWRPTNPPPHLYHGTIGRYWTAIQQEGLKPMNRHHVHLSADVETARRVGQRRGVAVILVVDSAALSGAGEPFLLASNGVWLVKHVPPAYLRLL